jgi:hypothetical protein
MYEREQRRRISSESDEGKGDEFSGASFGENSKEVKDASPEAEQAAAESPASGNDGSDGSDGGETPDLENESIGQESKAVAQEYQSSQEKWDKNVDQS